MHNAVCKRKCNYFFYCKVVLLFIDLVKILKNNEISNEYMPPCRMGTYDEGQAACTGLNLIS